MEEKKTSGGYESLNAMYIKLIPSSGHGFIVKKKKKTCTNIMKNKGYAEWARTVC